MHKYLIALGAVLALLLGGLGASPASAAPAAVPTNIIHDIDVTNGGSYTFWVCNSWSRSTWTGKDCGPTKTAYRLLYPGKSSKEFGWKGGVDGVCLTPRSDGKKQQIKRLLRFGGWRYTGVGITLKKGSNKSVCLKVRNNVAFRNTFRNDVSGGSPPVKGGGGASW